MSLLFIYTKRKFHSCYNKCLKRFFGIPKYSSLSTLLLQTDLPSSSTLVHTYSWCFKTMLMACDNAVVSVVSLLIWTVDYVGRYADSFPVSSVFLLFVSFLLVTVLMFVVCSLCVCVCVCSMGLVPEIKLLIDWLIDFTQNMKYTKTYKEIREQRSTEIQLVRGLLLVRFCKDFNRYF